MSLRTQIFTYGVQEAVFPHTSHADVSLWRYKRAQYVVKRIAHYIDFQATDTMAHEFVLYYRQLRQAGIPVPPEFECFCAANCIICITPYMGNSLRQQLVALSDEHVQFVLMGTLDMLRRLFVLSHPLASAWLALSLDMTPDNFTLQEGKITYIDFTPPLRKARIDQPFPSQFTLKTEVSELPIWKNARYFHQKGVILTFLTKFWAAFPQHAALITRLVGQFLREDAHGVLRRDFMKITAFALVDLVKRHALLEPLHDGERMALQAMVSSVDLIDRDELRLAVLLLTPTLTQVSLLNLQRYLVAQHICLAWEGSDHVAFFRAVFRAYKYPEAHEDFRAFVFQLAVLAATDQTTRAQLELYVSFLVKPPTSLT